MKEYAEYSVNIISTLKWQACFVALCAAQVAFYSSSFESVLAGGLLVMLSTWHVYHSVATMQDDRIVLMKAAGLRFMVLLAALGFCLTVLQAEAVFLVAGMVSAYIALYVQSLVVIFRKMKGS